MSNDIVAINGNGFSTDHIWEEGSQRSSVPDRKHQGGSWSFSVAERRASHRLDVHLSTSLRSQGRTWKGVTKSIGFGGLSMAVGDDVPAVLNQRILLSLSPDAGELDSVGMVCGIRGSGNVSLPGAGPSGMTLAVQFLRLSAGDEQLLASFFNEGRVRSMELRLAVALVAQESEDALVDVGIEGAIVPAQPPARFQQGNEGPRRERRHQGTVVGLNTKVSLDRSAGDEILSEELMNESRSNGVCVEGESEGPAVTSEYSECFRPSGPRIVLCHDRPRTGVSPDAPIVVLAPGYGESKRDYVPLAYYLAGNGFHVVRYDNVNHVGESDGVVTQFRLQDMESDLETVLDHVAAQWPNRSIGLVATSLAGRVALKVTGHAPHVKLLVLINGIMDVRHTLQAVHQEDLIGEHLAGVRKGVVNILGLTIDADRWLEHAVQGNYADLDTTKRDAERLQTPIVTFHAEHDAWVDPASIQTVEEAIGPYVRHSYVVPGGLHRLQESPRKARTVYRQIVSCCRQELWPERLMDEVVEPSHREIGVQNRVERERGKGRRPIGKADHVAFWKDYLHNFQTIPNVADFWRLMDQVYRLMGDCHHGERILDAGCGNGNFGVFLQLNQAFRQRYARRGDFRSPDYVGVDFVPAALTQTTANFEQVGETLRGQFPEGLRSYVPMSMRVCRADLESPLPFPDHSFDRVVCNLVIGYVRDPLFTLREYLRVLAPQGRLVISNLKPYADLSAIYRSFVETAQTADHVEEGRRLLDNSGKIKAREGEGVFHFFHQAELDSLLRAAGVAHPRVYSTFGNQAVIAVAEKGLAHLSAVA
ncbi:MAG: hypothetical protein OJF47_002108 [Nitrospira sp.]|jgi:SAM-dependent methyltransferase/alpha-beta hydrolase superfamily lysophospholipase|nr:MAG: hypothetical protein OJF47_002108 [Nitrospira sp.]